MLESRFVIEPVGVIRSSLTSLEDAPLQGDEGNYTAWLDFTAEVADAITGIHVGDELIVLTWLHLADRAVLQVHPRGNPQNPLTGVFATRSQDRPNPIGLHQVSVLEVEAKRIRVARLEAIDGTPILDIKPVLKSIVER